MESSNLQRLGEAIKARRIAANLSVRQLAPKSGLTPATLSRLENGAIDKPRPEYLQRLAEALETEVEEFYAMAGFLVPAGLPELRSFLRAKYALPEHAINQIDEYFQALRPKWEAQEEGSHDRGDKAA